MTQILGVGISILFSINGFFLENEAANVSHEYIFPYDLTAPVSSFDLDVELEEISGLTLDGSGKNLFVNNDEEGILYLISKNSGAIEKEIPFWKDGDYEGIEKVGNSIFVVKSTGTIYEVSNLGQDSVTTTKHKFFLSKENDVEALGYDAKNNRLLLGCKGKAGEGEAYLRKKAVYGFDLNTKKLMPDPIFLVTIEDVCSYLGHCSLAEHTLEKLHEQFDPHSEKFNFSPSSLAIHPKTGNIYITSSKGKLIIVLDSNGKILHIEKLKKKIHPQPEGLCFDLDGTLWLSNEKKKEDAARLYKFAYQP